MSMPLPKSMMVSVLTMAANIRELDDVALCTAVVYALRLTKAIQELATAKGVASITPTPTAFFACVMLGAKKWDVREGHVERTSWADTFRLSMDAGAAWMYVAFIFHSVCAAATFKLSYELC